MLQNRSALSLLLITVFMLLVVPILCHPESVEAAKQDIHELESKIEAEAQSLVNGHVSGSAQARLHDNRRTQRSIPIGPKLVTIPHSKMPIELDLLIETDDVERTKRFDDYGHMRFGKRFGGEEQFDDYGHMRFGR